MFASHYISFIYVPKSFSSFKFSGERIPPASTLIFECELVKIDNGPKPTNVFNEIDGDKDGFITRKEVSIVKTSVTYVMYVNKICLFLL